MDFSQQYYGAGQPYQFLGIPPPTPSHSNSAPSEDFNHSPPVGLSLPRPSIAPGRTTNHRPQDIYDQFQNFENYPQFDHSQAPAPAFSQGQNPPTPPTQQHGRVHGIKAQQQQQPDMVSPAKTEIDQNARAGSNSAEEDDMTPAQSRRKAQNRAAYVHLSLSLPSSTRRSG